MVQLKVSECKGYARIRDQADMTLSGFTCTFNTLLIMEDGKPSFLFTTNSLLLCAS